MHRKHMAWPMPSLRLFRPLLVPETENTCVAHGVGAGGGDPFAKRLKSFADLEVPKFAADGGVISAWKWIAFAERMVLMMDSVPTERARRELLSHQMTGTALAWWQGIEASLGKEGLAAMTVEQFRGMFLNHFVPETSRDLLRTQFRDLR